MSTATPPTDDEPTGRSWWLVPPGGVGLVLFVVLVAVGVLSGAMAIGDQKVVLRSGGLHWAPVTPPGLPQDVVFTVGAEQVTERDLKTAAAVRTALTGAEVAPDARLAQALATGRLLEGEAAKRNIFVSEPQVDRRLDEVAAERYDGDRDALLADLEDDGVSVSDLDREVRHELQVAALLASVAEGIDPPTTEQASAYFDEHQDELTGQEYRLITNAVMKTEEGAGKVVARYENGEAMGDLARRYSQDDATRLERGDLGAVSKDMLLPAYADVAFAAEPETVFGPVETPGGWDVGEVRKVLPAGTATFEDVEPQAVAGAAEDLRRDAWDALIAKLLVGTEIRYADAYRPADPAAPDLDLVVPPGTDEASGDEDDPDPTPGGPGSGPLLEVGP